MVDADHSVSGGARRAAPRPAALGRAAGARDRGRPRSRRPRQRRRARTTRRRTRRAAGRPSRSRSVAARNVRRPRSRRRAARRAQSSLPSEAPVERLERQLRALPRTRQRPWTAAAAGLVGEVACGRGQPADAGVDLAAWAEHGERHSPQCAAGPGDASPLRVMASVRSDAGDDRSARRLRPGTRGPALRRIGRHHPPVAVALPRADARHAGRRRRARLGRPQHAARAPSRRPRRRRPPDRRATPRSSRSTAKAKTSANGSAPHSPSTFAVELPRPGRYEVRIHLDGHLERTLAMRAGLAEPA